MVVEDDTAPRQALCESLQAVFPEARIVMSESREAGLELARRARPRVIVLDSRPHDFGAFEFVERLRGQEGAERVAIVALTGDMSPDTLMKAESAGFTAFLRKPADRDRLDMVLRPLFQDN